MGAKEDKAAGKEILRNMIGGTPSDVKESGTATIVSYNFGDSTRVDVVFRDSDSTGRAVDIVVRDKDSGREYHGKHVDD